LGEGFGVDAIMKYSRRVFILVSLLLFFGAGSRNYLLLTFCSFCVSENECVARGYNTRGMPTIIREELLAFDV
jgi:hypothetical protein